MEPEKKKERNVSKLYQPPPEQDYSKNYIRLTVVIIISVIFIGGEVVAGIIANSIAIISDAVHLVSDTIAFIFSFLFLYLSKKPPTSKMTFGYHRMELLGALANIFIIWFLIIFVMYEATIRLFDKEFVEKPFVMLIAAGAGLVVNIAMYKILHGGATHSHGLLADDCHGHGHQHGHEHGHGGHQHKHEHKHEDKHSQHEPEHQHAHGDKEIEGQHSHEHSQHSHKEGRKLSEQIPEEYEQDICLDKKCNSNGPGVHYHQNQPLNDMIKKEAEESPIEEPLLKNQEKSYCQEEHQHYISCYLRPQRKELKCRICSGKHRTQRHDILVNRRKNSQDGYPGQFSPKKYKSHLHSVHEHHDHDHIQEDEDRMASIGMQAAILHALSDMIMSVGLIISSLAIYFFGTPNGRMEDVTEWNPWHLFDPIATYIFSIVSLASTIPVIKNSYYLLMESTPSYIDIEKLQEEFEAVEGVIDVHDIHVWDLKPGKTMVIAHVLARTNSEREVLIELSDIVRQKKIYHSTFQVQEEEKKEDPNYILCHHDIH